MCRTVLCIRCTEDGEESTDITRLYVENNYICILVFKIHIRPHYPERLYILVSCGQYSQDQYILDVLGKP